MSNRVIIPIPNIENDKFTPGPLPEVYADRPALLQRFTQGAAKRLIIVSAPAGSGKTVSSLLWVRDSGRKPVWIGLDALDNSATVFYKMFCTGILSAQTDNERMAAILQDGAFASAPVEHTVNLLAEFRLDKHAYVLTLDDFHTITNPVIIRSLPLILRRLPHAFVTLVLTRNKPNESLAALLKSGRADLIGPRELAFSEAEIKAYFAKLGHDPKNNTAQAILNFSGGWAIGINALAQSDSPVPDGYGGHSLERYISKQIWAQWDDSLRAFMLSSAALDEMPVSLCQRITGRADAGTLLEKLLAENAFVVRISDSVYRYHYLFLDFLRAQPEYAAAHHTEHWHAAAEYYLATKDYLTARRYAYQSGNTEIMLSTLNNFLENRGFSIEEYLSYSKDFFLSNPMEDLCEKCPVLYISCAWVAFLTGNARSFEKYVDKMLAHLPVILIKYPDFGEIAFSIIALDYRTPFDRLIAQAALLPPIVFQDNKLRAASMTVQMPFMHRSSRDYHVLIDTNLHAHLKKTFGRLLKSHFDLVMHDINAGFLLEQNRLNEALAEAHRAVSLLDADTVKEMRFAAYMHLAAVYAALHKDTELKAQMEVIREFVHQEAVFYGPIS